MKIKNYQYISFLSWGIFIFWLWASVHFELSHNTYMALFIIIALWCLMKISVILWARCLSYFFPKLHWQYTFHNEILYILVSFSTLLWIIFSTKYEPFHWLINTYYPGLASLWILVYFAILIAIALVYLITIIIVNIILLKKKKPIIANWSYLIMNPLLFMISLIIASIFN